MDCKVLIKGTEVTVPLDVFQNHLKRVLNEKKKLGFNTIGDPTTEVGSTGLDMSIREVASNPDKKIQERIKKVMDRLIREVESKTGEEMDFEDFLNINMSDVNKGPKWTFDNYSKLKAMWETTGRIAEDIHDDYFSTDLLIGELTDIGFNFTDEKVYSQDARQHVAESNSERRRKDIKKNPPVGKEFDPEEEGEEEISEDNPPNEKFDDDISKYENLGVNDNRQTSDSPSPANLGLIYKEDEEGNIVSDVKPNLNSHIDNSVWLNPDELSVGQELIVKAPESFEEVMDVPVIDWSYNDETGEWKKEGSITFGELVARDGIEIGSKEYIRRVPMKAYTKDGREAIWIRDMAWINPNNYSSKIDKAKVIDTVRKKTFNIRNTAFKNGTTTIQITKRDFGSFTTFSKMGSEQSNDLEFNIDPTSVPVVATSYTTFKINNEVYNLNDLNSKVKILNKYLYPGSTYALRYYGTEINSNGVEVEKYLAVLLRPNLPSNGETLNRAAHNNIKYGVSAVFYMKAFKDYQNGKISKNDLDVIGDRLNMDELKAKEIIQAINSTYKVNIESFSRVGTGGMSDFLNNFVAIYTGKKSGTYRDALTSANSEKHPDGQAFLYISSNQSSDTTSGGQFGINIKGLSVKTPQFGDDDFGGAQSYTYPLSPKNSNAKFYNSASKYLEGIFSDSGALSKMRFDPSVSYLGFQSLMLNIDDNGAVQGTRSYDDFVKSNMKSNVMAFKVETSPGNYRYITDMQPRISFEQVDTNAEFEKPPVTRVEKIVKEHQPESPTNSNTPIPPISTPETPKVFGSLSEELENLPEELRGLVDKNSFVGLEKDIYLKAKESEQSLEGFTNYSGAAKGSDKAWEQIGKKLGLGKQVNYIVNTYDRLTAEQKEEVEVAYLQAVEDLGRRSYPNTNYSGKLVRRDYLQAKAADAVFAIGTIVFPGDRTPDGKYLVKSKTQSVDGGTGYATQMAINMGKPVYVFDQPSKSWYKWDYNSKSFEVTETPILTTKFAGIGTRNLTEDGIKAIEDVYNKTIKEGKPKIESDLDFSLRELNDSEVSKVESISTNRIPGVDPIQQKIITQGLYNAILESLSNEGNYNIGSIHKLIIKAPEKYLRPELDKTQDSLTVFYANPQLKDQYPQVYEALIIKRNKLSAVLDNQSKITSLEEGNIGDLTNAFQKFFQEELDEQESQELADLVGQDDTGEVEEQYDKDMMTKDITTSFSKDLQIFFSGLPKKDKFNKEEKTFFTGLKEYEDSKNIIGALRAIMSNEDSDYNSLIERLADKSATNPIYIGILDKLKNAPFKVKMEILYKMNQDRLQMQSIVAEKKNGLDITVVDPNNNEAFVSHRIDWSANMVHNGFVTETLDSGEVVYDAEKVGEALEKLKDIRKQYLDYLTKDKTKEIGGKLSTKEDFDIPEKLVSDLWDFMTVTYGIDISPEAFHQFITENFLNLNTVSNTGFIALTFARLNNLNNSLNKNPKIFFDDKRDGLHSNINDLLKYISETESYFMGNPVPKSFRTDGKVYQGTVQKTMVSKLVDKLKDIRSDYYKNLSLIPYSKGNYLLDALKDTKINSKFGIRYMGPKALAEKGKKYKKNESRKINSLPEADTTITELAFFAETEGITNYKVQGKPNIAFRLARMFNPTLSDKSQAVFYTIPVIDLKSENVSIIGDELILDEQIQDFLVEQIFDAEVERIVSVLRHNPNISNYKKAGAYFNSIAGFNNIIVETTTNGTTSFNNIIDYIHTIVENDLKEGRKTDVEDLKITLKNYALVEMSNAISEEVIKKVDDWKRLNILRGNQVRLSNGEIAVSKHLIPNRYFEGKNFTFEDDMDRAHKEGILFATDFVINNFLNQNNTYQLIAGDIALYAKGKTAPKERVTELFQTGITNSEGEPVTIEVSNFRLKDIVKFLKTTGENVTKRMAAVIAPGSELANSKDDKYIHIFINDVNNATSVSAELIKQAYGEIDKEGLELIAGLDRATEGLLKVYNEVSIRNPYHDQLIEDANKLIDHYRGRLSKKYPNLGGYFHIDAADAQEYTTWREHLDILLRQGRLDKPDRDKVVSAYEKLSKGEEVNAEELMVIMNPIKPVYTGPITEYAKDPVTGADILTEPIAMRTVYIKSSSFPLLPQLTSGLAIDKTRQHMEYVENKTGKNVRLSYESANKVGHVPSGLTTADLYNSTPEELFDFNTDTNVMSGKVGVASLVLDREFFKIQQDTPNKTTKYLKKGKDNMVTMGSQMWKLLMGNGINVYRHKSFPVTFDVNLLGVLEKEYDVKIDTEVRKVNGRNIHFVNGPTLDMIKTLVENRYFNTQKEILFTELGLNESGISVNPDETKRALKEIIDRELKTGSYPQYATDEIDLSEIDTNDLDFTQPIWMTNNADKFETLLQGIITSRLIKIKMPGNQHISASSEGFWKGKNYTSKGDIVGLEDLSPDIQSKIIWTNPSKRGELKPTILKNGKIQTSEVLIGSHFRHQVQEVDKDGNVLLDPLGNPKYKTELIDLSKEPYSKRDSDGFLYLDLNMIDSELLDQFSFRIPTSSHQSGAMLRVVGFLPPEMGDILVVPKEHTTQIGEDFDIDKRNIYKNHYTVSKKSGKIQKLNSTRFLEPYDAKEFADAGFLFNLRRINTEILDDKYLKLVSLQHKLSILQSFKEDKFETESGTTFLDDDIYELTTEIENLKEVLFTQDFSSLPEAEKIFEEKIKKSKERYKKVVGPLYKKLGNYYKVRASQKARTTFYEDSMVNLYKSVFMSPDSAIQNKVNKVLSMDVADVTANAIYNKIFGSSDSTGFTTYSDSFQREQQKLGAAGKLGIGQHSNAVTFQSQLERLKEKVDLANKITIGRLVSDGVLGISKTLDKAYKEANNLPLGTSRDVADVHTENQNSATDNVKAQIMGKRNENEFTMGVLTMMTYRGFDQDIEPIEGTDDHYQISSLLISQPSIRKYVEYMESNKALPNNNELSANEVMLKVYREYVSKLSPYEIEKYINPKVINKKGVIEINTSNRDMIFKNGVVEELRSHLTGQFLYDHLIETSSSSDALYSLVTLNLFNTLKEESDALNEYQKLINMNTSGLGLSYFEVIDREETLIKMLTDNRFNNISKLVTEDFFSEESLEATELSEEDLKGYYKIRNYYIKPSTTEGVVLLNSLVSANSVINTLYPYKSRGISYLYEKLKNDSKNFKEDRIKMIRELKDFFLSDTNTGYFEGSVEDERERLLLDTPGKQSLASFLKDMYKRRDELILENDLLKDFRYNLTSQRGYSYINHSAGGKSPADKNDKAKAFIELLQDSYTEIGEWNGEVMTPQKLALNLYNYSMLTANDQGISNFREYLPNELDKIFGVDKFKREMSSQLSNEVSYEMLESFYTQFMQQNIDIAPNINSTLKGWEVMHERMFKDITFTSDAAKDNATKLFRGSRRLSLKDFLSTFTNSIQEFKIDVYDTDVLRALVDDFGVIKIPYEVVTEDGDTTTEYSLYKYSTVDDEIVFTKIDGFNKEYYESFYDSSKKEIKKPIISKTHTTEEVVLRDGDTSIEEYVDFIDPKTGEITTLEKFFGKEPTALQAIDKIRESLPEDNRLSLLLKTIGDSLLESNMPTLNIVQGEVNGTPIRFGAYSHATNTIFLNNGLVNYIGQEEALSNMEVIAEVLAEELLHSLQIEALGMYVQFNSDNTYSLYNESSTPPHVKRILSLYEEAVAQGLAGPEMLNIKEFIAAIYTRPDFRVKLDKSLKNWKVLFMQALRQALQEIFNKSSINLPENVNPSDYLRENINILLGDTFKMQDEIAQEILKEGYISNGFRMFSGIGITNTFNRGGNRFINETLESDNDFTKRKSFSVKQIKTITNKVLSGETITVLSTANRSRDSKEGVAQSKLVKGILENIGAINNTVITSKNASKYFQIEDNGITTTIKYLNTQQTLDFPDINENCS